MKCLTVVTSAVLAASIQISTALASTTSPAISLHPLSAAALGVNTSSGCQRDATVDGTPYWEMPAIAAEQGVTGIARVKIQLTPAGILAHEAMYSSAGNPWLDEAALTSARMTRFSSEVVNCEHVGGTYLYEVDF